MLIVLIASLLVQATPAPSPQPTQAATPAASAAPAATASSAPPTAPKPAPHKNPAKSYKKIPQGTLTKTEVRYALTHQLQMVRKVRAMHTIPFSKLRLYKLSSSDLQLLHSQTPSSVAYEAFRIQDAIAQTGSIGSFLNLLLNVNVSDALNGSLNNNNVTVSLNNVLNGNKIAIGQVVGIYVNGGGIITTIVK